MKCRARSSLLACVLILCGLFGHANAAIVNLNNSDFPYDLGADPSFSTIYRVTHFGAPPSTFGNTFLFSLTTPETLAGFAIAPNIGPGFFFETDLTRIRLFQDAGPVGPSAGDSILATDSSGPLFLVSEMLLPGAYYFRVIGETTGAFGGRYFFGAGTGALPAVPVPEPSTYALMLAGLGMIAFAARRRSRALRFQGS